jgi:hypothetical protein
MQWGGADSTRKADHWLEAAMVRMFLEPQEVAVAAESLAEVGTDHGSGQVDQSLVEK